MVGDTKHSHRPRHSSGDRTVASMLNKLRRGIFSPVADPRDLEDCYGTFSKTGIDPLACFSEACRMYAAEVGSMHVATDPNGQTIVAQSGDEGTEIPDDDFVTLASPVTSQLREALRTREVAREI